MDWDKYGVVDGVASDPRCENCMVHCGYEPTASLGLKRSAATPGRRCKFNFGPKPKPTGKGNEIAAYNGVTSGNGHLTGKKAEPAAQGVVIAGNGVIPPANIIALPTGQRQADAAAPRRRSLRNWRKSIARAQENLLRQQKPDGHWVGELIVDSTLCSDYVLFMHWVGEVDETLQRRCVRHILKRQLPDGGWNIYYGGPSEINAWSKPTSRSSSPGHSPDAPFMQEARANILRLGGIPRMNTYSKLYLALLGQFPWKYLPAIPVEMVLLPELVLFQHLQNVVLEPGHAHPARDHQSFQADPRAAARQTAARALSGRHGGKRLHPAARPAAPDLAQFFPARRPRS